MIIRNERVEREESEEIKKNESMMMKVWEKALVCTNYQCDWSTRRYKAVTLVRLYVT